MTPAALAALLALSAIWGGSYLLMRIASPVLGPVVLIALRVALGGAALLLWAGITRRIPSPAGRWRALFTLSALNSALPFTLIATAQLYITASLAATLNATMPLFAAVVAAWWGQRSLTPRALAGILAGLAGVAILVGLGPMAPTPQLLRSSALSLLAAACYGYTVNYTRLRLAGFPPLGLALYNNLVAAVWLLPLVPFSVRADAAVTPAVAASVVFLGLLCTAVAYNLYFYLIVHAGPTNAAMVTYLSPAFGVLWGVLWLGERLTAGSIVGLAIILASVGLVSGGTAATPERAARVGFAAAAPTGAGSARGTGGRRQTAGRRPSP
ncbi:MAG: DMT family transporter [Armatimonadetes bacterium]|nr:DMT family transporter [Armatimonadota bacterium]